jgi:hypothetical protein
VTDSQKGIKKVLIGLGEFYNEHLSDARLAMYAAILSDCDACGVEESAMTLMRDPTQTRMPVAAVIRDRAMGFSNPDHEAIEAASRIPEAMKRFGYPDSTAAREFIGELGWRVVEREGGWEKLCHRVTTDQLPTLKAQWREMAKAVSGRSRNGSEDAPRIPGVSDKSLRVLKLARGIGKELAAGKDD